MADRYTEKIMDLAVLEHPNTVGSIWIDRISCNTNMLQTDRLGGVALARIRHIYQKNHVSWDIKSPANYQSLAMFLPEATATELDIIAFTLEKEAVSATMTLWDIHPGKWRVVSGPDVDENQEMDSRQRDEVVYLERGSELTFSFSSRTNTLIHLELEEPAQTDYSERPDLAISESGIRVKGDEVTIRVYSQGAVGTPETTLEVWNATGESVGVTPVPAMRAPVDLSPNWVDIKVKVPPGTDLSSGTVRIDPRWEIEQITEKNTEVRW
jgi:hypothetical protein